MRLIPLSAVLLASASIALAACGSDDSGSSTTEQTASPAAAVAAIDGTSAELGKATAALKDGDRAAAEEAVKEAYVSNFEDAEAALEEADAELNESIEDGLGKDLLAQFQDGASLDELQAEVAKLLTKLDEAKAKLQP